MEFRTVQTEADQYKAIELSKSIFKDNMAQQFKLLFGKSNWHHMFIAVYQDKVVSLVNYYPSYVHIDDCIIKVASIGSVCTKAEYRGQKLASKLLNLSEEQMKKENIDLVIISGEGGIYTEFGSALAGNNYEYLIDKSQLPNDENIKIIPYDNKMLRDIISIQKQEKIRFERSNDEFELLLNSQTYPDTFATYAVYLLEKNNKIMAYIIGILPTEGNEFGIKEFAGDRKIIFAGMNQIVNLHKRDKIHFATDAFDEFNDLLIKYNKNLIHQHASFKIINFCALMRKLKPYYDKIIPNNNINFNYENGKASFLINDEFLTVTSSQLLSQIVLGINQPINLDLDQYPTIKNFINNVFPIPFVWTNNINYQ